MDNYFVPLEAHYGRGVNSSPGRRHDFCDAGGHSLRVLNLFLFVVPFLPFVSESSLRRGDSPAL
jgi:hypothetical protein